MTDPDQYEQMLRALRGELPAGQVDELRRNFAGDPQAEAAFAEEAALEQALAALPNVPVSSNFTTLVVQQAFREPAGRSAAPTRWPFLRLARVAAGLAVLAAAGLLANHRYQAERAEQMARGAKAMAEIATALADEETPAPAVFEDFDVIQSLAHLPAESEVDVELLAALQR